MNTLVKYSLRIKISTEEITGSFRSDDKADYLPLAMTPLTAGCRCIICDCFGPAAAVFVVIMSNRTSCSRPNYVLSNL